MNRSRIYYQQSTGKLYALLHTACLAEDNKPVVVYTDWPNQKHIWVMSHSNFMDSDDYRRVHQGGDEAFDPLADVKEFHEHFDLRYDGMPRALPKKEAKFRAKFAEEELEEYLVAQDQCHWEVISPPHCRDHKKYTEELAIVLDSLVDQLYVILGTAYRHGMEPVFREAWRRVHTANMNKVKASLDLTDNKRDPTFDVIKPAGWQPPELKDLVEINNLFDVTDDE